jgi:hypothetical protein
MSTQNVILVGQGPAQLSQSNYLASGGEGSIYKLKTQVVKIFTDPNKMRQDSMADKIALLSKIKHPWIVAPLGVVTTQSHKPIGYYMPFAEGEALPRFFTNDFRAQVAFSNQDASELAARMQEVVKTAHQSGAVIVDGNEQGWVAKFKKGSKPEPRIVDVDSWQIGRFKAKVIMPSIKDYHASHFTNLSDWFSWGIVTFQLYTGIHPYKGTLQGYHRSDFAARMKSNASVFTPGVRLNRAVRDFSVIPPKLLSWYEREFQNGDRTEPPSPFDSALSTTPRTTIKRVVVGQTSGALKFDKLYSAPANDPVRRIFDCGVAILNSHTLISLRSGRAIGKAKTADCEVVWGSSGWLIVERVNDKIEAWYTEGRSDRIDLSFGLTAHAILRFQNRIFAITDKGVTELALQVFGKPILTVATSWPVITTSTLFFDGIGIQDALGSAFVVVPHGDKMLSFVKVPELDRLRVVSAKAGTGFSAVVTIDRSGNYHRFDITFSKDYQSYQLQKTEVDSPELVLALLPRGVGATVAADGELAVFVPSNGQVNIFKDRTIATDEPLFVWEDKVVLVRSGDVWQVSVIKKP